MIRNPSVFKGVPDIAAAAGVPKRSLYRHVERAGLVTPREIVAGSRILRAYALLREPAYSLEAVASHVHFTDAESLTKTMKWGVGMTPGRARDRMGPEEFVARLAARLAPGADLNEPYYWFAGRVRGGTFDA
jgi:transcriptional regulator GlxA family with amidase domain